MENMEKEQGGITMAKRGMPKGSKTAKNVAKTAEVKAKAVETVEVKEEAVEAAAVETVEAAEVKEEAAETVEAAEIKPEIADKEAKKTDPKAAKEPKAEKKEVKEEKSGVNVVIQFNGTERKVDEIVDKIKAEWVEAGHRVSTIKSLDVYIKPEDYTAYYVINGKVQGKVWM